MLRFVFSSVLVALLSASTVFPQGTALFPASDTQRDTSTITLTPVIVTPTHATERLSPVTFSNLDKEEIEERYSVQDIPVMLSQMPSSTFYSEGGNGIGYNYIRLRGFDQRRISVMVNGIPQNDPEDHNVYWIDFPDLMGSSSNIQVQRGAGSAFYGPPAIGGSINMVTNPFSTVRRVTLETMFGFQEFGDGSASLPLNTRKYTATINSGLIDGRYMLFGRLGQIKSDGYRKQSWATLNSFFLGAVRIDKNMTTRFHAYGGPIRDGLAYEGLPKFAKADPKLRRENYSYWDTTGGFVGYQRRPQETESFSQPHFELMNEWRINSGLTLSNTIFYVNGDGYFDFDGSWADTSMLRLGSQYGIPVAQNPANTLIRAYVGNNQWGWLPRVNMIWGPNSTTLGAEIRLHRSVHWGKIEYAEGLPAGFNPDYHFYEYNGSKNIFSFYVHNLWQAPNEMTTVMTDVQLVSNRYGIENEKYLDNHFTYPYFFVNPHIGINHNFNAAWNAYVSAAYTSREPTLRNLYAAEDSYFGATPQFRADTTGGAVRYDFTRPYARPERLLDFEFGIGYRKTGLTLVANVFWMDFRDELVKQGSVDIFGQPVTGNADKTRHYGLELEGSADIFPNVTLSGNATFSVNRLTRYREYDNGVLVSHDGNPIAGFPDEMANLRLSYHPEGFTAALAWKYVGPFYTDNYKNEANKNDAFRVWNAQVLYHLPPIAGARFMLRAEVNNLLNTLYFTSGEGASFYPAAERNYLIGLSAGL